MDMIYLYILGLQDILQLLSNNFFLSANNYCRILEISRFLWNNITCSASRFHSASPDFYKYTIQYCDNLISNRSQLVQYHIHWNDLHYTYYAQKCFSGLYKTSKWTLYPQKDLAWNFYLIVFQKLWKFHLPQICLQLTRIFNLIWYTTSHQHYVHMWEWNKSLSTG